MSAAQQGLRKMSHLLKAHGSLVALVVATIGLGISFYNSYELKILVGNLQAGGGRAEVPEKFLKEAPKNLPVLGSPEAKVTLVEFGDFQCPFCGKFFKDSYPLIKKEYIDTGKLKFVYVSHAFLGQESIDAAEAAKCALDQGKFWEYFNELYTHQDGENQGAFNSVALRKFATASGLNLEIFNSCIAANVHVKEIEAEGGLANKYGVNSTPSFIIGNQVIRGAVPIDTLRKVLDNELNK